MSKIAIIYCKRVKDLSCIACAKCFKSVAEKTGAFVEYDDIDLVALTDCGDCPGLLVSRISGLKDIADHLDRPIDTVHLGTCVKTAMETSGCPLHLNDVKKVVDELNIKTVVGTH